MDIDKIISDYLTNDISENDKKKLEKWLDEDPIHREELETLKKIWKSSFGYQKIVNIDDEREKVWNRINHPNKKIIPYKHNRFGATIWVRYAAVIALIITVGYLILTNPIENQNQKPTTVSELIERKNPLGQKSRIQLPDGSTVWLNADSKLSYPSSFNNQKTRRLYLEGEAYFEVTENPDFPFEVYTKDLVVTALGTSFNVDAFEENTSKEVSLNTGKVKVECLDKDKKRCSANFLDPGQSASFDNKTGNINISEFKKPDPFAWKDGKIIFHHATFNEVITVLSRWYNVHFEISGSLQQEWNYSAEFDNEILENIMESLKFSEKINYEINGSTVKLKI